MLDVMKPLKDLKNVKGDIEHRQDVCIKIRKHTNDPLGFLKPDKRYCANNCKERTCPYWKR